MALPRTSTVPEGTRRFAGYDGELGDLLVRLVRSPEFPSERQVTPVANADLADQLARTPEEVVATGGPAGLHAFTLDDPQAGEGRRWAHRPTERPTDALRFWSSRGIDVSPLLPGEQQGGYTIRLARAVERVYEETDLPARGDHMTFTRGRIFLYDPGNLDTVLELTDTGAWASPTSDVVEDGTFAGATFGGNQVALGSIGPWVVSYGSSSPSVSGGFFEDDDWANGITISAATALSTEGVVFDGLKGRLITQGAPGAAVRDVGQGQWTSASTPVDIFDVTDGVVLTAVADGGIALLVATSDGAVRLVAPDSDGALTVVGQVPMPPGQHATAIGAAFGRILFGTTEPTLDDTVVSRIYTGELVVQPDGSFEVGGLRLRHTFEDVGVTAGPSAAVQRDESILVGIPGGTNRDTSIWRYNTATDSITEEAVLDGVTGSVTKFGVIGDVLLFGVEGSGIWRQVPDAYQTSGWIISSAADFYDHRSKAWHTVRADGSNIDLADTAFIVSMSTDPEAQLDPDHSSWVPVLTVNDPSDLAVDWPVPPALVRAGRYIIIKLDLSTDSAGTNTPHASATIIGSHKTDDITIVLPVNVSDRIERPGRRPIHVRGLGDEYDAALRNLAGEVLDVVVYQPSLRIRGQVVSVGTRAISRAAGSTGLAAEVTVAGKIVAASQPIDLTGTMGLSTLGTVTLGGAS